MDSDARIHEHRKMMFGIQARYPHIQFNTDSVSCMVYTGYPHVHVALMNNHADLWRVNVMGAPTLKPQLKVLGVFEEDGRVDMLSFDEAAAIVLAVIEIFIGK